MPPSDPNRAQQAFAAALLDPDAPVPEGLIRPDGRAATKRFDVYRNNVTVSLTENLAAAYPVTAQAVGDEFFHGMARTYARANPPRSPLMILYGDGFAAFIESFAPAQSLPWLADLARIERAWLEAYHAADARPAPAEALGAIPPDALGDARLTLHPSSRALSLSHPALTIWSHVRDGNGGPLTLPEGGQDGLIVRADMDVEVFLLPPGGAACVRALAGGATLGAAAGAGAAHAGFDLGAVLTVLVQSGAIIDVIA